MTNPMTQQNGRLSLGKVLHKTQLCTSCEYCCIPKILEPLKKLSKSPVLFVHGTPSKIDYIVGDMFISPEGRMIRKLISSIFPPENWYLTNALVCAPILSDTDLDEVSMPNPTVEDMEVCFVNLERLINAIAPCKIIALGTVPSKILTKKKIDHVTFASPKDILKSGGPDSIAYKRFQLQLEKVKDDCSL